MPVCARKVYRRSGGLAPHITNLDTRWRLIKLHVPPSLHPKRTPVPTKEEAGWSSEKLWTFVDHKGLLRDFRLPPLSVREPLSSGLLRMSSGNSLPTFRDNLLVPSSGVFLLGFLTLESGTCRLFRNVGEELPLLTRNNPEERSSQKDLLSMTEL